MSERISEGYPTIQVPPNERIPSTPKDKPRDPIITDLHPEEADPVSPQPHGPDKRGHGENVDYYA